MPFITDVTTREGVCGRKPYICYKTKAGGLVSLPEHELCSAVFETGQKTGWKSRLIALFVPKGDPY